MDKFKHVKRELFPRWFTVKKLNGYSFYARNIIVSNKCHILPGDIVMVARTNEAMLVLITAKIPLPTIFVVRAYGGTRVGKIRYNETVQIVGTISKYQEVKYEKQRIY